MSHSFRFIIHIGTEKTGTTTLQHVLAKNRELLEYSGVYYLTTPQRIESRGMVAAALGNQQHDEFLSESGVDTAEKRQAFREATWQEVHATLSTLPKSIHTVVVSSEHFHSRLRHQKQVAWIRELFAEYANDFCIICYLRQQAELVESFYTTALKNGSTRKLDELAEKICKKTNHYYNYRMLLSLWAETFGDDCLAPRIFDKPTLMGGDVVKDFLSTADIDVALKRPRRKRERYNESLSPLGQHLLRGMNVLQAEVNKEDVQEGHDNEFRIDGHDEEKCKEIRSAVIQSFPGSGEQVTGKVLQRIKHEFLESNTQVQQSWLPSQPEGLFSFSRYKKNIVEQNAPITRQQIDVTKNVIDFLSSDNGKSIPSINHCAGILKKLALHYEDNDIELSYELMDLALRIRPRGSFIKRKVAEYSEIRQRPLHRLRQWARR